MSVQVNNSFVWYLRKYFKSNPLALHYFNSRFSNSRIQKTCALSVLSILVTLIMISFLSNCFDSIMEYYKSFGASRLSIQNI